MTQGPEKVALSKWQFTKTANQILRHRSSLVDLRSVCIHIKNIKNFRLNSYPNFLHFGARWYSSCTHEYRVPCIAAWTCPFLRISAQCPCEGPLKKKRIIFVHYFNRYIFLGWNIDLGKGLILGRKTGNSCLLCFDSYLTMYQKNKSRQNISFKFSKTYQRNKFL